MSLVSMPNPKAIVFDLGNVLLHFDFAVAASNLASRCRVSARELQDLLDQSPLLHRYETGLLTSEEFFVEVQRLSGFHGRFAEFDELFADMFAPIKPMIRLHAELRNKGFPTYLFSNTNPLAVSHIRGRFPFFKNFDGYVLSYEHGAMKPDPRLYEVAERMAGYRGTDLLYLDDRPENIATAVRRGWQTILHVSPERTIEALRKSGILG